MRFKCQIDFGRRNGRCFVSVFLWLYVMCACVWIHTDTKPPCLLAVASSPPHSSRLRLGRSWGLTFHFPDPLFHRANSYAGLEMWLGETKIKAISKIIHDSCCKVIYVHLHFDDITSIMNLTVNKDHQRTLCKTFPHKQSRLLRFYFFTLS